MSAASLTEMAVAGERLVLLPERAVVWPARATVFVADPHFGKAATFRVAGLPVPHGTTAGTLGRLDRILAGHAARRLIFLGDFLHAREGRTTEVLGALAEWRARHPALEVVLIRGNHDRRAGDPPAELAIDCRPSPSLEGPFVLRHEPGAASGGYALAGHLHPCFTVRGGARERVRLPCFWFGPSGAVLPAFGEFTGCAEISPRAGDRVFVVAQGQVVAVAAGHA